MLLAVLVLGGVAVVRLFLWRDQPRSRVLTVGMLAVATSYGLALERVDRFLDPRLAWLGANLTDLFQLEFLALGLWALGAVCVRAVGRHRLEPVWSAVMGAIAVAVLVAWWLGDGSVRESDEVFELRDSWSVVYTWISISWSDLFALLMITASVSGLRAGGPRRALYAFFAIGVCCLVYALGGAAVLIFSPDTFPRFYHLFMQLGGTPALLFLAASGMLAIVNTVRRARSAD
ncbi:hypothetical protein ACQPW1_00265 [Nocardia sp. CA-128927]|uniref:hypothetical protein n=1 Tax=Nocardia sp. CA-128927 TaxID=3239975 RepID=UPI003D9944D3